MTNTQRAESLLATYRKYSPYESATPTPSDASKKRFGTWAYANKYDALYDMYSQNKNFNTDMWRESVSFGEQDNYLALLEQNKDNVLSNSFYDPQYYDYEAMMMELYLPVADDTKLETYTKDVFNAASGKWETEKFQMTQRQYLQYTLDNAREAKRAEIQRNLEQERKDNMSFWQKFGHDTAATLGELGEGLLTGIVGTIDFVAGLEYATGKSITGDNFADAFVEWFGELGLTQMEKNTIRRALDEYERKNTHFRDIDGNLTNVGKYFVGISNSIGMMLPSILLAIPTGGTSLAFLPQLTFYTSLFSNSMYETATDPATKDSPSWTKILNVTAKTVAEVVIEKALGAVLGSTIQNSMLNIGRQNLSKIGNLTSGAGVKYLLKSAGQEGLEEFLQDFGTSCIDAFTGLWQEGYGREGINLQTLIDSFVCGAMSSIVLSTGRVGLGAAASSIRNAKVAGSGDMVIEVDGKLQKVGGFTKLYYSQILSDFNGALEELKTGKFGTKKNFALAQEIYSGLTAISQFYSSFDQQRIKNCEMLLNRVVTNEKNEYAIKAKETTLEFAKSVESVFNDMFAGAQNTHRINSISKQIKKSLEKDTTKKKLEDGEVHEATAASSIDNTERNPDGTLKLKESEIGKKLEEALGKKKLTRLMELHQYYDNICTVDGHVAIADDDLLFVSEAWLENYTSEEIYEFLVLNHTFDAIRDNKKTAPVLVELMKFYKEFVGSAKNLTDEYMASFSYEEDVLMNFFFNKSFYQAFILSNDGKNIHTYKKNLFTLYNFLFEQGKEWLKMNTGTKSHIHDQQVFNRILGKIKETWRDPTIKAIINWGLSPEELRADEVLSPRDLEYINLIADRKRVLHTMGKTGTPTERSAHIHLVDTILDIEGWQLTPDELAIIERAQKLDASEEDITMARVMLDVLDMDMDSYFSVDKLEESPQNMAFIIPHEAAELAMGGDRAGAQHVADCMNEFRNTYGVYPKDLLAGAVSGMSQTQITQLQTDMQSLGISDLFHFVQNRLENMLGNDYVVVPSSQSSSLKTTEPDDLQTFVIIPEHLSRLMTDVEMGRLELDIDLIDLIDSMLRPNIGTLWMDDVYVKYPGFKQIWEAFWQQFDDKGKAVFDNKMSAKNWFGWFKGRTKLISDACKMKRDVIRSQIRNESEINSLRKSDRTNIIVCRKMPASTLLVPELLDPLLTEDETNDIIKSFWIRHFESDEVKQATQNLLDNLERSSLQDYRINLIRNALTEIDYGGREAFYESIMTGVDPTTGEVFFSAKNAYNSNNWVLIDETTGEVNPASMLYEDLFNALTTIKLSEVIDVSNFQDENLKRLVDEYKLYLWNVSGTGYGGWQSSYHNLIVIGTNSSDTLNTLVHETNHLLESYFLHQYGLYELYAKRNPEVLAHVLNKYRPLVNFMARLRGKTFTDKIPDRVTVDWVKNESSKELRENLSSCVYYMAQGEIWARGATHNKNAKGITTYFSSTMNEKRLVAPDGTEFVYNFNTPNYKNNMIAAPEPTPQMESALGEKLADLWRYHQNATRDVTSLEKKFYTRPTYHTQINGNAYHFLSPLLSSTLGLFDKLDATLDDVIRDPQKYLRSDLLALMEGDFSEGNVYYRLKDYLEMESDKKRAEAEDRGLPREPGISIDITQDGRYVFVNDNAFDDLLTDEMYDETESTDTTLYKKYGGKSEGIPLTVFYNKKELHKLGLDDIEVIIRPDVKSEAIFDREHPGGLIFLNANENITNAALIDKLNHEFRHILQHRQGFARGFTPDIEVTQDMVNDLKKQAPDYFKNSLVRSFAERRKKPDETLDETITRYTIYFLSAGEQNAYAYNPQYLSLKPMLHRFEGGRVTVYMPWYNAKTGEGRYTTKYLAMMSTDEGDSKKPVEVTKKDLTPSKAKELTEEEMAEKMAQKARLYERFPRKKVEPKHESHEKVGVTPEGIVEHVYRYKNKRHFTWKKAKGTNLEYFYKKGEQNQMDPDLQNFIIDTTGRLEELPFSLVQSIKRGTLTKQALFKYIRSSEANTVGDDNYLNPETFALIKKHFFPNTPFESLSEVDHFINFDMRTAWAAIPYLYHAQGDLETLLTENSLSEFNAYINLIENTDLKGKLEERTENFGRIEIRDSNGKLINLEPRKKYFLDEDKYKRAVEKEAERAKKKGVTPRPISKTDYMTIEKTVMIPKELFTEEAASYLRVLALQNFGGSLADAFYIAWNARKVLFWKEKQKEVISLDAQNDTKRGKGDRGVDRVSDNESDNGSDNQTGQGSSAGLRQDTDANDILSVYTPWLVDDVDYETMVNEVRVYLYDTMLGDILPGLAHMSIEDQGKAVLGKKEAIPVLLKIQELLSDDEYIESTYAEIKVADTVDPGIVPVSTERTKADAFKARVNVQKRAKNHGEKIAQAIRDGYVTFEELPNEVKMMFKKVEATVNNYKTAVTTSTGEKIDVALKPGKKTTITTSTGKKIEIVLNVNGTSVITTDAGKKIEAPTNVGRKTTVTTDTGEKIEIILQPGKKIEVYELDPAVYEVGRGRKKLDGPYNISKGRDPFKHDTTEILKNERILLSAWNAIKPLVRQRKKSAEKGENARKVNAKDRTAAEKRMQETIDELLKTHKEEMSRIEKNARLKVADAEKRAREAKRPIINIQYTVKGTGDGKAKHGNVVLLNPYDVVMPEPIQQILSTCFSYSADTKVQWASIDKNGNLYQKENEDKDFESIKQHEIVDFKKFMEINGDLLSHLKREHVLDSLNSLYKMIPESPSDLGKYQAFKLFLYGFFYSAARDGKWNFSDKEVDYIRELYEAQASANGIALNAVKQMTDTIKPYVIGSRFLDDWESVGEDEKTAFVELVSKMQKEKDFDKQRELQKQIVDTLEEFAGREFAKDKYMGRRWSKKWWGNAWKKVKTYRYLAMLSGPGTWVRNIMSNYLVEGLNNASDAIGALIFRKTDYRDDQWDLRGVQVSNEVKEFTKLYIEENPSLKHAYELSGKYDKRGKLKKDADIAVAVITNAYLKYYKAENSPSVVRFIQKRISDEKFVKTAARKYLNKMLTIEVEKGNIDLADGLTGKVYALFADAVIQANEEYMHKRSVLADLIDTKFRARYPVATEAINFFFPFLNSGFNWFVEEAINLSPIGLIKGIGRSRKLETRIAELDAKRDAGEWTPNSRMAQYLARRDIGKGVIGTLLWTLGAILCLAGRLRIEEEKDKFYLNFGGDMRVDISNIFGSSSILIGASMVQPFVDGDDTTGLEAALGYTLDTFLDGFFMADMMDRHQYDTNTWDFVGTEFNSALTSFIPQFVQVFVDALDEQKVRYSKGFRGNWEYWLNSFVPTQPMGNKVINVYTGELEDKNALPIPIAGGFLRRGVLGPKIYWVEVGEAERMCREYEANHNELSGEITIKGQKKKLDRISLNKKYGELNKASLATITSQKHKVQMPNGNYKTLHWDQLSDDQRKRVINRTFSNNAELAKIYTWTQVEGHKYYASASEWRDLKTLGITKNVYKGDKGFVE